MFTMSTYIDIFLIVFKLSFMYQWCSQNFEGYSFDKKLIALINKRHEGGF
jgi:hypothetical protein